MQDVKYLTSASFHYGLPEQEQEKFSPIYQPHTPDKSEASVTRFNEDKKLRLDAMAQFEEASRAESGKIANRTRRRVGAASGPPVHSVSTSQDVEVRAVADSTAGEVMGKMISNFIESLSDAVAQEAFMTSMKKRNTHAPYVEAGA